jgi:hypothetical protein
MSVWAQDKVPGSRRNDWVLQVNAQANGRTTNSSELSDRNLQARDHAGDRGVAVRMIFVNKQCAKLWAGFN